MDPWSPFAATGLNPGRTPPLSTQSPAIHSSGGPPAFAQSPLYHPDHPLFWVAGIVLVTFGFIGANSAIRVGKFKASVNAGST